MNSLSFIGPIGTPELIFLLILAAPVVGGVLLVVFLLNRKSPAPPAAVPPPLVGNSSSEHRLAELESLRSGNLVSDDEYEKKRKQILDSL